MKAKNLIAFLLLFSIQINILEAQTPELIIPESHDAYAISITPDNKWMITLGHDAVKIWDYASGRLLKNLQTGIKSIDPLENITYIASNNENAAFKIKDTLYIFNFGSFTISAKAVLKTNITALAFSPDGSSVFLAGNDEDYKNINIFSYQLVKKTFEKFADIAFTSDRSFSANTISFSPDGARVMIASKGEGAWIFDKNNKNLKKNFSESGGIYPYTFLKNGNILAFTGEAQKTLVAILLNGSDYQPIKKSKSIFNVQKGYAAAVSSHSGYLSSNENKLLLSYNGEAVLLSIPDLNFIKRLQVPKVALWSDGDHDLAMNNNGSELVSSNNLERYNTATNEKINKFGVQPFSSFVQFVFKHANGIAMKDRTINFDNGNIYMRVFKNVNFENALYRLTADGNKGFVYNHSTGLNKFDPNKAIPEFERITKVDGWGKNFVGMQIFDKFNLLALVGDDGVYVMDLNTLKLLYIIDIPFGLNYIMNEELDKYCDISPDKSKMILHATYRDSMMDKMSCVDLATKDEIWNLSSKRIRNLRFSNDGQKILFTSADSLITLDANSGKKTDAVVLPGGDNLRTIDASNKIVASRVPYNNNSMYNSAGDISLYDLSGKISKGTMKGTGDPIYNFLFLKNEKYLITEEEGGLCLWNVEQKRKIGKLYLFENSSDWVFISPDGRFDATSDAINLMYYVKGKEVLPIQSLYEKYYTPGLLKQIWENGMPAPLPEIENLKIPPTIELAIKQDEKPLSIDEDSRTINTEKAAITVQAKAEGKNDVISEIRLYQNNKLVQTTRNLVVEDDNKGEKNMVRQFPLQLQPGKNILKGVAINSQRTESTPVEIVINYKPAEVIKPDNDITLHMIVVGVNTYKNPKYSLNYANADARAFEAAMKAGGSTLFNNMVVTNLFDENATKDRIKEAFVKVIAAAKPQDLLVFYYAGHGVINDKKEFYLVPYDVVQLYGNDGALAQKGLSAAELQDYSKNVKAQKQLFILDACQSAGAFEKMGALRGAAEEKAIAQLARSTGTQWLAASGSEQFASEFEQLGHGTFTYCILEGLKGEAGKGNQKLTVKELDAYLQDKVPEITQKYKGTPQYPSSYSYGNDFPIIIIKK